MPLNQDRPFPIRPRLKDVSLYIGMRGYFITINTYNRKKYFIHEHIVFSLVTYLKQVAQQEKFDVVVFTYMPNHVHFVLLGKNESSNVCRFMKSYKQLTGYKFKQTFGSRLWATSFHDHVLRKEESIKSVGRYVLKNPVRAGLVKNICDYKFSGSFVYDLSELAGLSDLKV